MARFAVPEDGAAFLAAGGRDVVFGDVLFRALAALDVGRVAVPPELFFVAARRGRDAAVPLDVRFVAPFPADRARAGFVAGRAAAFFAGVAFFRPLAAEELRVAVRAELREDAARFGVADLRRFCVPPAAPERFEADRFFTPARELLDELVEERLREAAVRLLPDDAVADLPPLPPRFFADRAREEDDVFRAEELLVFRLPRLPLFLSISLKKRLVFPLLNLFW